MALPNPTLLNRTIRFRPTHIRAHSRSPSRSPVRKAQFTAQYLDPLLRNLSPDSTLKALQATETIPTGPEQDVLIKSIADVTSQEREIGIRAAFAAQKLREWRNELSKWTWPDRKQRAVGAGFLPPPEAAHVVDGTGQRQAYLGCLPLSMVDRYEQRIDEIRDALETLEMEEIKDHILQAHTPSGQATPPANPFEKRSGPRMSYGRMRDFTALITATVIQALPDLATVTMLIETWNVRLTVLRGLPMLLSVIQASKAGVRTASVTIRDPNHAPLITLPDFETTKKMLGDKVSELGGRIDGMLDLLEGYEDALPQGWIDSLETIELDYATWVVDAQRLAMHNQSATDSKLAETSEAVELPGTQLADAHAEASQWISQSDKEAPTIPSAHEATTILPGTNDNGPVPFTIKPALRLDTPSHHGHRRGISEVSIADSAYSAFSEAEIVDATQTEVLPSPKISVVDSPSRAQAMKPPMLQRASTASIEVISKDQLKRVDLRRSMSADLLAKTSSPPDSTPSKPLAQLLSRPRTGTTPVAELEDPISSVVTAATLKTRPRSVDWEHPSSPTLPRKSSKRKSMDPSNLISSVVESSQKDMVSPIEPTDVHHLDDYLVSPIEPLDVQLPRIPKSSPMMSAVVGGNKDGESLEAKIQDILLKLPAKIRLARNEDGNQSNEDSSASSTRASTPTAALTLSPVKTSKRSSASGTDVRVFHLTQHGQSRDTAPIKLFVRTVGAHGERVMVRVGGGWADLGEYLKEYSLHHGRHSVSGGQLEVAQYPDKSKDESLAGAGPARKARHVRGRSRSPSPPRKAGEDRVWTPPPVPAIPSGYTVRSPTTTSVLKPNGVVETIIGDLEPSTLHSSGTDGVASDGSNATANTTTTTAAGVTTTTTVSMPMNSKSSSYTPLGAAGPKAAARRSVTFNGNNKPDDGAWVEGVVGQARAVSSSVVHGPTTTTTTKVTASAPSSRRASVMGMPSATQKMVSPAPSSARTSTMGMPSATQKVTGLVPSPVTSKNGSQIGKRRSILGLGDVGSIRRVFLRKKSDK